jgi:inosose dehydratase
MRLSCHTITWGGVVGHPVGVTSIKDLFYLANESTERALWDISKAGYQGFELFDGNLTQFESDPDRFHHLLEDIGLSFVAVYSGANFIFPEILGEELWRIEKAATLAGQLGATYLVVGGGAQRSTGLKEDDYRLLADGLERVIEIATRNGLIPCYHPHLTTIIETPEQLDKLMALSPIGLCTDTAHLSAGGGDPAAIIGKYADRVRYVHLKDLRPEPLAFLPLGKGVIDFPAVLKALTKASYDGWVTVELDSYEGEPREAAEMSKAYVETLL